jgi:acyl-[acyl-carrier-protein]-phospholipid O-acyltransferase / long-chain-fatty-acid--[acyl-carrier-protein] ligase
VTESLLATRLVASVPLLADSSTIELVSVILVALVAAFVAVLWLRPGWVIRPLLWVVTHTIYRLTVFGREHVPLKGPALLVCNHVSYIDWFLLLAAHRRFIRFVIWAPFARVWGLRHLLRWARVIPIDSSAGPRAILQSLRVASEALNAGDLVCIFAEGGLTRTGFLLPFHRGFEQILKRSPAPVVPVCLDHVWGSIFSYHGGKVLWKWPQELPYPVSVAFGPPLSATSSAAEVRLAIQKLSADCSIARIRGRLPVHRQFVRSAARHPFRPCMGDSTRPRLLRYSEALTGAIMLARRLKPLLGDDRMVGLWLPPSIGGALANIALAFLGKTSVNLNYTSSAETVRSAVRQCGLRHVLTSRRFGSKVPLDAGPDVMIIFLEDFAKTIGKVEKLLTMLAAVVLPGFVLDRWMLGLQRTTLDDTATIIFSSGSTGDPKGVQLSHRNVAANAESMIQAIDLRSSDQALGVLPFFHSFGYTVTLWVPLQVGASAFFHPDPRQAKEIGEICRKHESTIFLTTPTFLRFCLRRCDPNDFNSLRILMCGAEKLPQPLAREFDEKFHVLPLEGYGCTELSPAAAANVPDRVVNGTRQVGNKPGTIGQPLPGIAARIVNADTFETLPPGQEGLLLMYGANVMQGYLGKPELTAQVIRDGWYVTGDIAKIDEDGFIVITGRLARFAKVGGEMVPLERIEEELQSILGTSERVCAVAAVPDEKRGERLVVLHTHLNGTDARQLCQQLGSKGLPNLWLPGDRDFFEVPELPILGSGKMDLKRLKEIALEQTRNGK